MVEIVKIFADSDPSVVAYFDQISWPLGDVYEGILLACQIQIEFVGICKLKLS